MSAASQPGVPEREACDKAMLVRLPSRLLDAVKRQAADYGATRQQPTPVAEYVRLVLEAHTSRTACPCSRHCPGG